MIPLLLSAGPVARRLVPLLLIAAALVVVALSGAVIGHTIGRAVGSQPTVPVADVASRLHACQELATTRITLRSIQRARADDRGLMLSNTDEVLCRVLVNGDYGLSLTALNHQRIEVQPERIRLTLPVPALLAPGFTASVPEILDQRTTRWISDAGPGALAALQQARTSALAEAPQRAADLGVDAEVRTTTRAAIRQVLPSLLGLPHLRVEVRFDDEPAWPATDVESSPSPPVPRTPGGAG